MTSLPHVNTATSHAAAVSMEPHAGTLEAKVLAKLREVGSRGGTDEELQMWLLMNPSTQRPRRVSLAAKGLITKAGERRTRSGRWAQVWVATP